MIKLTRLAPFAAGLGLAGALAVAAPASAVLVPHASPLPGASQTCAVRHPVESPFCGTWGLEDGSAVLGYQGSPFHPASGAVPFFGHQAGSGFGSDFLIMHPLLPGWTADNGAAVQLSNGGPDESRNEFLNADIAGHVTFVHGVTSRNQEWIFIDSGDGVNGQYVNGATGQALCLGAHGAISAIPAGGGQACTIAHFIPQS
jgi:hypothetical protein